MADTEATLASKPERAEFPQRQEASTPGSPKAHRICRLARVVLVAYVAVLLFCAFSNVGRGPIVQLEDMIQPRDWMVKILTAGAIEAARFLGLGFLMSLSVGLPAVPRRFLASLGRWLLAILACEAILALLALAESGRLPDMVASGLSCACFLVGAWIGLACLQGRRAVLWLVPQLSAMALAICGAAMALVNLAVDVGPLSFEPSRVTSAEKRRLANVLEHSRRIGDELREVRLSERDVNLLLAMGVPRVLPGGKARIALGQGAVCGELSASVGKRGARPRWINVHASCRAELTAGRPEIHLTECRVGRVSVPKFLLDALSSRLTTAILNDADLEHVLAAIDSVRVAPDGVEAVFRRGAFEGDNRALSEKVIPSLIARLGQKPDIANRVQIYVRHLVAAAEEIPGDERFGALLQAAFALARERSKLEDPVLENRAVVLALAILLGHPRVETLVGRVTDHELRVAVKRTVGRVPLRGRRDWCQHFWVSAALALTLNESLSDEAGLTKEELDAGEGGSGFSFADYLADRAGTLFALAATRDEPSARRMQDRLAGGPKIDDIFPPAADLPEEIPDAVLQIEYGGVKGERYNQVIAEIERRLARCAALSGY